MPNKPKIHLWTYNNPFNGISDQVEFFVCSFRQHGYTVSVGRRPCHSSLNVVIENFSAESRDVLIQFGESTGKRVAVIMTEHLDFSSGNVFIHGEPLWSDNDYMHPATQVNRIRYLMECIPYIRCFWVLGDLPELVNISSMLPGIDVRCIPFPRLDADANIDAHLADRDLLFTGFVTEFRANIHRELADHGFSISFPEKFSSRKKRNDMNRQAKIILNIPQRERWRWLSLMRIFAALRCGRATVSLGTQDSSKIASSCIQLNIREKNWSNQLRRHVENWEPLYHQCHENYMSMAADFEREKGFPDDLLEYWAITDGLKAL